MTVLRWLRDASSLLTRGCGLQHVGRDGPLPYPSCGLLASTHACPCPMRGHGHMHVLRALAVEEGALSFMGVSTLDAHSLPLC